MLELKHITSLMSEEIASSKRATCRLAFNANHDGHVSLGFLPFLLCTLFPTPSLYPPSLLLFTLFLALLSLSPLSLSLSLSRIGTPKSVTLWHDGSGSGDDWHLGYVSVHTADQRFPPFTWRFTFDRWMYDNDKVTKTADPRPNPGVGRK